jgi:hypothetical protein
LFEVKRGVATGGNKFFVRPREEFTALGISQQFLRPILPSSRHIVANVIERTKGGYPALAPSLALLDCRLSENVVRKDHPKLWKYFNSAQGKEVRGGYLSRNRAPWYLQETRPVPPILATYMGRGKQGAKPFRFFWNRSEAIATNVYLLLIPKAPLKAALTRAPALAQRIVEILNQVDSAELVAHGRVYGGGLHKLEPRELSQLKVAGLADILG